MGSIKLTSPPTTNEMNPNVKKIIEKMNNSNKNNVPKGLIFKKKTLDINYSFETNSLTNSYASVFATSKS